MKRIIYHSPFGPLVLIAHTGKIVYCNWDEDDCRNKESKVLQKVNYNEECDGDMCLLNIAVAQLDEYFSGSRKEFEIPLYLYGTDFQKNIWNKMKKISYGKTITYGQLGKMCGGENFARAVASACGANPLAILVPCHRVVGIGKWSGGYTGGVDKKIKLLELEKPEDSGS